MGAPPSPLSSRPERTRISCHVALDEAACAPFLKEGRMKCENDTRFHRKSGVAQWRDLQFRGPVLEMFLTRTSPKLIFPTPDEAFRRAVRRIDEDDVLWVPPRRVDGQKDHWPLQDPGQRMNNTALEKQ